MQICECRWSWWSARWGGGKGGGLAEGNCFNEGSVMELPETPPHPSSSSSHSYSLSCVTKTLFSKSVFDISNQLLRLVILIDGGGGAIILPQLRRGEIAQSLGNPWAILGQSLGIGNPCAILGQSRISEHLPLHQTHLPRFKSVTDLERFKVLAKGSKVCTKKSLGLWTQRHRSDAVEI